MKLEPGLHCHISEREQYEEMLQGKMPVWTHIEQFWLNQWFIVAAPDHPYLGAHSFPVKEARQVLNRRGIPDGELNTNAWMDEIAQYNDICKQQLAEERLKVALLSGAHMEYRIDNLTSEWWYYYKIGYFELRVRATSFAAAYDALVAAVGLEKLLEGVPK